MPSISRYFDRVSKEEYVASSFSNAPSVTQKMTKRPVGRPRKRPVRDADADKENVSVTRAETSTQEQLDDGEDARVHGEEPTAKRVRCQYTMKQKQRVVVYARHHGVRPTQTKFGVPRKNIQRWLKDFRDSDLPGQISVAKRGPKKQKVRRGRQKAGRKLSYPVEIDGKVLEWVLCMRERHLAVSTLMLRDKARSLIKQHNPSFKASEGWAVKFIHRHRLVLRAHTSVAQKLPGDLESKLSAFLDEVKTERQKYNFPKDLMGNMDETPLYFDMVPSRTIEMKGAKEVKMKSTGAEKRRVTVVLACLASGKTLPPMIIFKGKCIIIIVQSLNL